MRRAKWQFLICYCSLKGNHGTGEDFPFCAQGFLGTKTKEKALYGGFSFVNIPNGCLVRIPHFILKQPSKGLFYEVHSLRQP